MAGMTFDYHIMALTERTGTHTTIKLATERNNALYVNPRRRGDSEVTTRYIGILHSPVVRGQTQLERPHIRKTIESTRPHLTHMHKTSS